MIKKMCVVFLSLCIATAMFLGVNISYSDNNDQDAVTMCILEPEEELY